ncbi:hypothetical protein QVD17_39532 [Tagetes erecta]|uniref:Uncharacterized protein n=1 Tax=Tagetes erecta TaxID=13708 RepID=A0AAD8JU95_TARER|nr:hypothetical protein QVD17_39532 [Tagetes erecta]
MIIHVSKFHEHSSATDGSILIPNPRNIQMAQEQRLIKDDKQNKQFNLIVRSILLLTYSSRVYWCCVIRLEHERLLILFIQSRRCNQFSPYFLSPSLAAKHINQSIIFYQSIHQISI